MANRLTRSTQLAGRKDVRDQLLKIFGAIDRGYADQIDRADDILDFWDAYNCRLGSKQGYAGNARIFVPLIHNAVEARKTRFLNQLFPQAGRFLEVTTEDGEIPHAAMALLEMYVTRAELRTKVVPALLVAGDVEGQYTVCVTWGTKTRHSVSRETSPIVVGGIEHPDLGEVDRIVEETVEDSGPEVDIIADPDFLVLPVTAETIDEALDCGGSVTALCRWTEDRVEQAIADGEIDKDCAAKMLVEMRRGDDGQYRDIPKKLADAAGIKAGGKYALLYRTWTKIKVEGETRLVLAYYAGDQNVIGARLCPYWNDKCDYISTPVKKMPGVFKGMSPVKPCADMQYAANDAINEGMDSATYSMLPIVMTDPEKNPKIGTMVMDLMAVWETNPRDTQFAQFPQLYQHAFEIVAAAERYIDQTLGVNPSMLPQSTGRPGAKRTQAEVAMEQQVDLLMTADATTVIEHGILTPVVQRMAELDAQFRDNEMTVRSVGELGVKVQMETVPPLQMGKRWAYRWFGVEAARAAQQIQQQISALNVIKGMSQDPSVAQAGYRLDLVPVIRTVMENAFGPRLAPEIFKSIRDELALDPEIENEMLIEGFTLPVSPLDNDAKHLQEHMQAIQQHPELRQAPYSPPSVAFQHHVAAHQAQMQAKQMQQALQQAAQQQQGGGRGAPGQVRGPRQGATPQPPRIGQQPAGRIAPDAMKGGVVQMPRRVG